MLDLYYFSFNVTDQVHQPDLPGVLVSPPPKKSSRGRDGDVLILYMALTGRNPYTPEELNGLLQQAGQAYYQSSGSLTAGMRAAADACNTPLMERNLKTAREEGVQSIALLNVGVLRGDNLFLAVVGGSHALVINNNEVQDFYDPQAGRGLGVGTSVNLRYFQASIQPGDVLVFTPEMPEVWTPETLGGSAGLTLEHLRRRLLNSTGPNLKAVVVKFQTGNGEVHALRHRSTTSASVQPMAHPAAPQTETQDTSGNYLSEAPRSMPAPRESISHPPVTPATPTPTRPVSTHPAVKRPVTPPPEAAQPELSPEEELARRRASQAAALEAARAARQRRLERKQKAAAVWNGWKNFSGRISQAWQHLLVRLAPQRASTPSLAGTPATVRVSPALLVFIAIAVPLVVVAISMTVYLQTGRGEQQNTYLQQAIQYADQARAEKDPVKQRGDWEQVLQWLDKAEEYGVTAETRTLRIQAQNGVDAGDAVIRLAFRPINSIGFAQQVHVTRMVANGDDLYLLDSSNGSVLRLFQTAQGYLLDKLFSCGPGPSGAIFIGPIIDIAAMPPVNPDNATIAAMDGNGNLLYCIPGKNPLSRTLAPPNVGWGKIAGIQLSQDSLFVLDVLGNAIWQYTGQDLAFTERPRLFSENFNLNLGDVLDMTMYEDNVYFLHNDGRLAQCTISKIADIPTRCVDPAQFSDPRPGREPKTNQMPETLFMQLQSINAPDPSLYLLDGTRSSIYRFSMALNFQDQMRPSGTTDTVMPHTNPTAFTITPRRVVFLAYGNQVFIAQMP